MAVKNSILKLRKQICNLEKEIKKIQDKCPHKNISEMHGSRRDYEGGDLIFWTDYKCPDCGKSWIVEESCGRTWIVKKS